MIKTMGNSTLLAIVALGLIACSGVPAPKSEMALSESAIKDAESAGAREFASLEFRRANEKYAEAAEAMKEKEYSRARRLSDESRIDAELAEAKSYVEKSNRDKQILRTKLEQLSQASEKDG